MVTLNTYTPSMLETHQILKGPFELPSLDLYQIRAIGDVSAGMQQLAIAN
jgi:hypothetical protein